MARTHYHVVSFINGCLNDYDSGPIATLKDARSDIRWYLSNDEGSWTPAGKDRYESDLYILKIEECTESECAHESA